MTAYTAHSGTADAEKPVVAWVQWNGYYKRFELSQVGGIGGKFVGARLVGLLMFVVWFFGGAFWGGLSLFFWGGGGAAFGGMWVAKWD